MVLVEVQDSCSTRAHPGNLPAGFESILSPCGICQERLALWGGDVLCALTTKDVDRIEFAELRSLQPHHWLEAYQK